MAKVRHRLLKISASGDSALSRWVRESHAQPEGVFPGKGHLRPADEELRRLKREIEVVRQERDILKKALAIFSQEPK